MAGYIDILKKKTHNQARNTIRERTYSTIVYYISIYN